MSPSTGANSVFNLIEKLRGKPPQVSNDGNGNIILILPGNNNQVTINNDTYNLLSDQQTRRSIAKSIRPIERPGIDKLEISSGQKKEQEVASASKDDLESFVEIPILPQVTDVALTEQEETPRETVLEVLKFATQEDQKSQFTDGVVTFWALIEDRDFWRSYHAREYGFRDGDRFRVVLVLRQQLATVTLKGEYVVRKIINIIEPPTQGQLGLTS